MSLDTTAPLERAIRFYERQGFRFSGKVRDFFGMRLLELTRAHFSAVPPQGFALAGWNFTVIPCGDGVVELRTETRVRCAPDARLKFRLYWFAVRPGSGLIRRAMLRAIRLQAEHPGQSG